jgi:hypothetical protein
MNLPRKKRGTIQVGDIGMLTAAHLVPNAAYTMAVMTEPVIVARVIVVSTTSES